MRILRFAAALALLLAATPAVAQWQTPNHSIPIGRGSGTSGFGAAVPAIAGRPLVDNGVGVDPSFGTIANSGFTPGAANTLKGSLDGVTVTDVAIANCMGVNQALRWQANAGTSCGTVSVTTGYDTPINLGLSATAAAGALTINVTQASGSAPTSTNPVLVAFRNFSSNSGTVAYSTISSALSITIPSGATLGTSSGNVPFRIWIFIDRNGGGGPPTVGVATCSNPTTIFPCASWEYTLQTSATIGAGSTAAGTLYASSAATLDPVRIVGFCDFASGLTTAGTWAGACTTLQVFGPGIKRPGEVVQSVTGTSTTAATTTSATFAALTSGLSTSITPTSTVNLVRVVLQGTVGSTGAIGTTNFIQAARASTLIGNPFEVISNPAPGSTIVPASIMLIDAPASVSSTAYSYQGKTSASTLSFPPANTGVNIILDEIMG